MWVMRLEVKRKSVVGVPNMNNSVVSVGKMIGSAKNGLRCDVIYVRYPSGPI